MAMLGLFLAAALLAGQAQSADVLSPDAARPLFLRPPADLAQVASIIPRGNLNPSGGHIRPVKHNYLEYLIPRNGGADAVTVTSMARGRVVTIYQRVPTGDPTEQRIRSALAQGLLIPVGIEPTGRLNPRPAAVGTGDYACYNIPDGAASHALLVYHPSVGGAEHVKLRYSVSTCASALAAIAADPSLLESQPWFGDYVR